MKLKIKDHVITNKGRYGTIYEINDDKCIVKMGSKFNEIDIHNIFKVDQHMVVVVEYINEINVLDKTTVSIPRQSVIYDIQDVYNIKLIELVTTKFKLKVTNSKIQKITFP